MVFSSFKNLLDMLVLHHLCFAFLVLEITTSNSAYKHLLVSHHYNVQCIEQWVYSRLSWCLYLKLLTLWVSVPL